MRSMSFRRAALVGLAALALAAALLPPGGAQPAPPKRWYKGNLHTHTINSDGDSTPHDVATWYKEHRYHFLVLSDHNFFTGIDGLNQVHGAKEKFLLIPGEEVTDSYDNKSVHVNAYNPIGLIEPAHGAGLVETIQNNVNAIRAAQGLPSLNHPNFRWSITAKEILAVKDLSLFEVYNGHPTVHNHGGGGFASLDEMWDAVLTGGKRLFGIAVDDAHYFKRFARDLSNPGRGWVMVRAAALTAADITAALATGDSYASTGVELADVQVSETEYRVQVKPAGDARYTIYFLGAGGELLEKGRDTAAVYRFRGGEKYVRARVESSTGDIAWTQPVTVKSSE